MKKPKERKFIVFDRENLYLNSFTTLVEAISCAKQRASRYWELEGSGYYMTRLHAKVDITDESGKHIWYVSGYFRHVCNSATPHGPYCYKVIARKSQRRNWRLLRPSKK